MPVPRMIRIMCQNMAQNIKKRDTANGERLITSQSLTNPQGLNNEQDRN